MKWQRMAMEDAAYVEALGPLVQERLALYEMKKPYRYKPAVTTKD